MAQATVTSAFIGRADELRLARDSLAAAAQGRPSVVVVGGDAGVGKASVAAVGSPLSLAIEDASGHTELATATVGLVIAVPVTLFLRSLWAPHVHAAGPPLRKFGAPVAAALALAAAFTELAVLLVGLVLAAYVVLKARARIRDGREIFT